ncbi:PREDICTED: uncharacterized protein LOC109157037 [Ipomoea nil]|uniref:uncharacterized protein LOC109157037 n=1 Tax=Ipomoea nil TaxID=35883 RepID=UPI000900D4BF|nr:PREDICTED: uncharacterized protein LOC109157037 [Ipomoea nil]
MVIEYLDRVHVLVEELALAGCPISLDEQNLYVFRGLQSEFRAMTSSLITHGTPAPAAMVARPNGRSFDFQRGGRGRWRGGRGRGVSLRCQIFSSVGHSAVSCFHRYSDVLTPQTHIATVHAASGDASLDHKLWFPNTGATNHVTRYLSALSASDEYLGGDTLRVGNSAGLSITSIGHASFSTPSRSFSMYDVLHVPSLFASLLSVQRFASNNKLFFEFHPNFFVVKDLVTKEYCLRGPPREGYKKLHSVFAQLSIAYRRSCAYTHEHNGHVEHRLCHIVEIELTLMAQASVSSCLCDFSFEITVYLINRMLMPTLANSSPHYMIHRSLPSYSFLCTFGCFCYLFMRPYNRHKMDFSVVRLSSASPWLVAPVSRALVRYTDVSSESMTTPGRRPSHRTVSQRQPTVCTHPMVLRHMKRAVVTTNFPVVLSIERLVPYRLAINVVGYKWVFRTKRKVDGSVERHKAWLVVKGFNQVAGQDLFDTFSPFVKPTMVRLFLALVVSSDWIVRQLDVHNAFLNGSLSETVYMHQLPSYTNADYPDHVCLLQRSLYGLKQAHRARFTMLHGFLLFVGFFVLLRSMFSLFIYAQSASRVYLLLYVDDILVMGIIQSIIDALLLKLSVAFKTRDIGSPSFFLGIENVAHDGGLVLSQKRYMCDILKRVGMVDCKPLAMSVHVSHSADVSSAPYADLTKYRSLADWAMCAADLSRQVVSLCFWVQIWSSIKAEYKAPTNVSVEVTWVMSLLRELGISASPPKRSCDNMCATYMCTNLVFHTRTKHVEIDYHFVRYKATKGELLVNFISTQDRMVDIFIKPLTASRFVFLRDKLQVVNRDPCA